MQRIANISCQSSDVRTFTAYDSNHDFRWEITRYQFDFVDCKCLRLQLHFLPSSCHLIGTLAIYPNSRERRWYLFDSPYELLKHLFHHFFGDMVRRVSCVLLGFFIGWSHLFSTSAVAETPRGQLFEQWIKSVQNVGSFQMAVYARTTSNDNFAYFDPKADFVRIDIGLLRQNDSVFYRVEKQNGRVIVFDGQNQYMWVPNALYVKGPRAANFLEYFINLLYPERLLTMQKSAIDFSKKNEVIRTESDSTITLTFKGTEKNSDLQQLLETGKMGDCEVEVENVFTKNDGLLRFVKLWVVNDGQKTLLLHIDNIQYNVMMSRANLIQIPDTQWTDVTEMTSSTANDRLSKLQNENKPPSAYSKPSSAPTTSKPVKHLYITRAYSPR